MRASGVVIWVALLAAILTTGCSQGSGEGKGTRTAENAPTVLESKVGQETGSKEEVARTPTRGDGTTGREDNPGVGRIIPKHAARREAPFTAASQMSGGSKGAADSIRGVRFGEHEGYERAVIDFGSGGAPASRVPTWTLSSPTGEGYARITFPDVDATSVSDSAFGGSILDDLYVVRAPGGGMFVDVFATGAFQYRVIELSDPGRLALDYRPASVDLGSPIPAQDEKTVLLQPREGEAVTSPLRVVGYSRNSEASNTIILRNSSGNLLSRGSVLSNDWVETWGYFEASLEFPAFEGPATLLVGSESPRDGSFEGVEVPVTYGEGR